MKEERIIKRSISIKKGSPLEEKIRALIDQSKIIIGKRKITLSDLVEVGILKITKDDLKNICQKYLSAEDHLNKTIENFLIETKSTLSRDEIIQKLTQVNLKKLCKDN